MFLISFVSFNVGSVKSHFKAISTSSHNNYCLSVKDRDDGCLSPRRHVTTDLNRVNFIFLLIVEMICAQSKALKHTFALNLSIRFIQTYSHLRILQSKHSHFQFSKTAHLSDQKIIKNKTIKKKHHGLEKNTNAYFLVNIFKNLLYFINI